MNKQDAGGGRATWWGVARWVHGLGGWLGLALVFLGGMKLNSPERFADPFTAWGIDPALVPLTGAVEAALGTLILHFATRTAGALALVLWMLGAAGVHIVAGQPRAVAAPVAVALVAFAVAFAGWKTGNRPRAALPTPLADPPRGIGPGVGFLLRLVGVSFLIRWVVGGTVFWLALPLLALAQARQEGITTRAGVTRLVLLYLLVLGLGVSGIWGFVGHRFMSDQIAASIAWDAGSPFQHELAFYHLGMGVSALLCLWIRDRYWVAAGLTPAIFALGAGAVHVQDFLARGNTAPANWGLGVLFGNFLLPVALLTLIGWYARSGPWTQIPEPRPGGSG